MKYHYAMGTLFLQVVLVCYNTKLMLLYCLFYSDVRIGFVQEVYSFNESDSDEVVTDVILIREGNRQTEQMFGIQITVDSLFPSGLIGPATLGTDYRLQGGASTVVLLFPSTAQNVTFTFILNSDDLPEATEGFLATAEPAVGFPNFGPPQIGGAFDSTEIRILDNSVTSTCPGNVPCVTIYSSLGIASCQLAIPISIYHAVVSFPII